jgi:chromosome segregation ATPase
LEGNIQELQANLSEKVEKIAEQNNAVKLLMNKLDESESIIDNKNSTIENLQADLDDKGEIIEQLENDNKKLGQNLQMALSNMKKNEIQINSLYQEIDRLNKLKWYHKLVGKK